RKRRPTQRALRSEHEGHRELADGSRRIDPFAADNFLAGLRLILIGYRSNMASVRLAAGRGGASMQRREFVSAAAGAAAALAWKPSTLAGEQERKAPVRYPDPAVEVVDPRFAKYKVGNAAIERLY